MTSGDFSTKRLVILLLFKKLSLALSDFQKKYLLFKHFGIQYN